MPALTPYEIFEIENIAGCSLEELAAWAFTRAMHNWVGNFTYHTRRGTSWRPDETYGTFDAEPNELSVEDYIAGMICAEPTLRYLPFIKDVERVRSICTRTPFDVKDYIWTVGYVFFRDESTEPRSRDRDAEQLARGRAVRRWSEISNWY